MNKMFADREQLRSVFRPWTQGNLHSDQLTSPSETFHHERFLAPKIALIREKATLLFSENFIL